MIQRTTPDQLTGKYRNEDRSALFASFMSLGQSHHEAILVLGAQERLIGSAFALFRPLIEVCYRGMFVAFLATPEQVEKIKTGGEPYGHFNELAASMDKLFKTDELFTQYAGEAWKTLNGMTHGGLEQLSRRINEHGMVGAHFEDADVQNLFASSTSVLVRTSIQFLGACDRFDGAQAVSTKYLELYPVPTS